MKQGGLQVWRLTGSGSYQTRSPFLAVGHLCVVQTVGEVKEAETHEGRAQRAREGRSWRQGCGGQSSQELSAGEAALVPLTAGRWKMLLRPRALTPLLAAFSWGW